MSKLLLVGNFDITHIGRNLLLAAQQLKIEVQTSDINRAFGGPKWIQKLNWWLRGHRPPHLEGFSRQVIRICQEFKPKQMLATGLAPIDTASLQSIGELGIQRLIYLTDDPWNPAHRAPWFMKALPFYDQVFSVRRSNIEELRQIGCQQVFYLPFAYAPEIHYPEPPATEEEKDQYNFDIVFIGGADRDRASYISALIKQGFKLGLYGDYWGRFKETRAQTRGSADPRTVRLAIGGTRVALCLIRRANRDGNSMRTFEVPAIGACMLTEDTNEHREIFGEEGKAVIYFKSISEMIKKIRWLLDHEKERQRLAQSVHQLIVNGRNTYQDRLINMLSFHLLKSLK